VLRHFLEGNTRRPAGRSTGKRRTHPRQARTHTVGVASDPPVECFAVDGGEMRADIAQKAEKSRVTDVRVLRPSERAPENGTLALTRCPSVHIATARRNARVRTHQTQPARRPRPRARCAPLALATTRRATHHRRASVVACHLDLDGCTRTVLARAAMSLDLSGDHHAANGRDKE
jgi:hypothetical protein